MDFPSSSTSSASPLQLAMAALVGASLVAISAFFIHKRSVDQVLDRLIEIRKCPSNARPGGRQPFETEEDEDQAEVEDEDVASDIDIDRRFWRQGVSSSLNDHKTYAYRVSSSMPNVVLAKDWMNEGAKFTQAASFDKLNLIPHGLPSLQTAPRHGSNQCLGCSGSNKNMTTTCRPMTPKSPGRNAFEHVEDSDDGGYELASDDDNYFNPNNENSTQVDGINTADPNIRDSLVASFEVEVANSAQDQKYGATVRKSTSNADLKGNQEVETAASIVSPLKTAAHAPNGEEEEVLMMIRECLALRDRYVFREHVAPWMDGTVIQSHSKELQTDPFHFEPVEPTAHYFKMEDGVVHVYACKDETRELYPVASSTQFFTDMHYILRVISQGNARSACNHRLRFLEEKFRLHLLINADREFLAQKSAPHRDFYNIRKVDTHVHHSACMNQKHLLRFIKSKLRKEPDEVVIFRDGKYLTLKEVFESLDLTGHDLNVDLLDVHADKNTFHRFDKFNLKYNPCGQSRLREIFLKQDNLIQGRFLAEVTKQVLSDLEASKYQMAEYRVSIYGRKQSEWDQLASWVINNAIYSENAIWLIQLPRLYNIYRQMGIVTSFQNILDNVFIPLFEVTLDPNSHPQLHVFLKQVVGLDLVDDESKPERRPTKHMPKPAEWTNEFNPAYSYYAYYCFANLYTLNKDLVTWQQLALVECKVVCIYLITDLLRSLLRESKGMQTIKFRPHCGEAGDVDHLAAAFLLCHNISHGINLRKAPALQYLYYLSQIGLSMSPLSNNSLFLDYHRNPFPMFFQRGLNVSLSSDDPLQIHLTKEPLVEEYSVAAQVWKLTACDLCEIARNSVYQSGFSHAAKAHWLGSQYFKRGPEGNDIQKTNVPHMRIAFRTETWKEEMQYVYSGKAKFPEDVVP
ncbi:AMP deaminase-like isoform X3 [Macadamia integrifolia]|uniref:AMP deaminase-like isoform X3 n=1 Tax=Macadamia integrifolia TaxID=60698 RepID=UPI001C4F428F|nr:AMP deaminase-like isoform X3 [Macadamia integrifolia]